MFDYHALAPDLILAATVLAVIGVDLVVPDHKKYLAGVVGLVGLVAALFPLLTLGLCGDLPGCSDTGARVMFGGSYVVDTFALVLKGLFIVAAIVTILLSVGYLEADEYYQGEFYFLLLASVLGAVMLASSRDLITIFVSLELVSAPAFLLAGWRKGDTRSNEAALKFFLTGVMSAAVMLFGMSLVYGLTGEITFAGIAAAAADLGGEPAFVLAVVFVIVGFAFKVAAVPFHFWAPDTYQGAPTPVAAYLSVGSKAAGVVGMLTVCFLAFSTVPHIWGPLLWVLAVLSMTLGNLVAMRQTNLVRLLGYSSIAHAGFILVPFAMAASYDVVGLGDAIAASVTYTLIYAFMNLGAFGVIIAGAKRTGSGELEDWAGLNRHAPAIAAMLAIFFFSLAGIPPLAGWFAKFVMFKAVIGAASASGWAVALAAIAAVNAVIGLVVYARVVKAAYMEPVRDGLEVREGAPFSPPLKVAIGVTVLVVIAVGIYPDLLGLVGDSARALGR
ncbi:MAG: NADH-quinone oxidoreductase subunit N [Acidimicrobiia bacterium]